MLQNDHHQEALEVLSQAGEPVMPLKSSTQAYFQNQERPLKVLGVLIAS